MKKLNNKGITLIELIVSFAIVSVSPYLCPSI